MSAEAAPQRISDIEERIRILCRTLMASGHPSGAPSIASIKNALHLSWKRVADVMAEAEFTPWPAARTHRCVCRAEESSLAAFLAHAAHCALWRGHARAEALESRWRRAHHAQVTAAANQVTGHNHVEVDDDVVDDTALLLAPLPPELLLLVPPAVTSSSSLPSTESSSGVASTLAEAELREAILRAAALCDAALRSAPECHAVVRRPVLPSADAVDPSSVAKEIAADAAVWVRRSARLGETRREQLADAAREAARYNSELFEQRQRRAPFEFDAFTTTLQLLPAWRVATSADAPALVRHAELQAELSAAHADARRALLDAHRQAESDVRRLVLDRRHAALTGSAPPRRPVDEAFAAADDELARYPELLRDFDALAGVEPPQRPVAAYHHFTAEQRPRILAEQPYLSTQESAKLVGQAWRQLSPEERAVYEERAQQDKLRYEAAWAPHAVKEARFERVRAAASLIADRHVDFLVGVLPPPATDDEQRQQLGAGVAAHSVHQRAPPSKTSSSSRVGAGDARAPAARPSARRPTSAAAVAADDEDDFVPKPRASSSARGRRRGRGGDDDDESFEESGDEDEDEDEDEADDSLDGDGDFGSFQPSKRRRQATQRLTFG